MNSLDARTVVDSFITSNAILAVVMFFLWRQNRKRFPEFDFWMTDYVFQFVALVLIALRGLVPDFASIVVSNTLAMIGTVLLYIGLERFVGKKSHQAPNTIIVAVFVGIQTYFVFWQPNLTARNLNVAGCLLLISAQIAWLMLRRVDPAMRTETRSVGMVFGAYTLVNLVRIYFDLTGSQGNDFFKSSVFIDVLAMMTYQMLLISLTFALFLMVNRRLTGILEQDNQERKQAESALKKSETTISLAFQNLPDAIVLNSIPDGKIIEVNESFFRISGYSPLETVDKTSLDLNLWVNLEERSLFLEEIQKTGRVLNFETTFRQKSGQHIHGLVSGEIIQLNDAKYILHVVHDITERKEAENALLRQNEYLAALQETTIELVSQLDLDSLLENIAKRAARLVRTSNCYLGLKDEETGWLAPRVAIGAFAETPEFFPQLGEGEAGIGWQNGSPLVVNNYDQWPGRIQDFSANKFFSVIGVPLHQGGKLLGVLGLANDVLSHQTFEPETVEFLIQFARLATIAIENTLLFNEAQEELSERERVEHALLESEQRMSLVLQGANDGWWDCDLTRYRVFYSPKWWSMLGYSPDELTPDADLRERLTHPEDIAQAEEIFQNALQSGSDHYEVEYRLLHKEGHYVPILSRGYIQRDEKNVPIRISGTNMDLTARKQIEAELKNLNATLEQRVMERTTQLEASNKELEAFAYSVSHDLRAPLRGIDGWSMVLLEDKSDQLDEQGRKYLERVRGETQRMGQLIDDLLKLSRVTRLEMQPGQVNLSVLAQEIAMRLQEMQPERPIDFHIQPGLTVKGDSHLLEIALTNLLENACKFSSTRSQTRVEFGKIPVANQQTYFISDNGVGFDMANAKNLFGAFQRMHRQSEFPGNGVGLATVQRIIRRHGGRIWADAHEDGGATFYFTFEAASA